MKYLAILIFIFISIRAFAQSPSPQVQTSRIESEQDQLTQVGKIFTVRIVPSSKLTSFFIVGKKAADIHFDKMQIEATFYQGLNDKMGKSVILNRQKDHFSYEGAIQPDRIQLNIKTETPGQVEKLEIKMKNN